MCSNLSGCERLYQSMPQSAKTFPLNYDMKTPRNMLKERPWRHDILHIYCLITIDVFKQVVRGKKL